MIGTSVYRNKPENRIQCPPCKNRILAYFSPQARASFGVISTKSIVWSSPQNRPILHHESRVESFAGSLCFSASVANAYTFPDAESAYNRPSVSFNCVMSYLPHQKKSSTEQTSTKSLTLFLNVSVGLSSFPGAEAENPLPHWYTSPRASTQAAWCRWMAKSRNAIPSNHFAMEGVRMDSTASGISVLDLLIRNLFGMGSRVETSRQ
jgi:hypothetical protein